MSTDIKLNRIQAQLNIQLINEKYDFFYLETCDKYIKRGAFILDVVCMNNDIKAVKFESGKRLLVMMDSDDDNLKRIKTVLADIEEGTKYSIGQTNAENIEEPVLCQILINALGVYDAEFLKFNNLTGHLYCYHEDWLKHGKDKEGDYIWKVPTLEVRIDSNMCLHLDVRTFTSEKLRKKMTFKRKKFEDYPKYIFSAKKTLRRKLSTDAEPSFILRQLDGTKTEISFLNLQSEEKFAKSKMGVLQDVIAKFNMRYADCAHIDFDIVNEIKRIDYSKKIVKENHLKICNQLQGTGICIYDQIGDEYSKLFCTNIQSMLENKYGARAEIVKRARKGKLNISLIHNAEYYEGANDPHDKNYEGLSVQHITFEDFSDSSEFALATVIHEVIIKQDLVDGKLSLFNWEELGFSEKISFGIEAIIGEENRYFFMEISPDGTFIMKEQEFTLFEMTEYNDCLEIFEDARNKGETIKGIIKSESGEINIIKDTGLFTLPNFHEIKQILSEGDNKLRGKERREQLVASCLDIKLYEEDGCQYYFVGTIGEGMRVNVQRAAVIRKIEGYKGAELMFEELLPLMNVSFVHNGQLTVVPFPFKYLREYINNFIGQKTTK